MGMHFGLLLVEGSQDILAHGLAGINARLEPAGPEATLDDIEKPGLREAATAIQHLMGFTILYDGQMLLAHDHDLIVELSRISGSRACGCVGETVSGTFMFCSAVAGEVVRAYSHCHWGQSEAWQIGNPLSAERVTAFDGDFDCTPFFEAFVELGFPNPWPLLDNAKWIPCTLDVNYDAPRKISNALNNAVQQFATTHAIDSPPRIYVVERPAAPRPGWVARLRRLLGLG